MGFLIVEDRSFANFVQDYFESLPTEDKFNESEQDDHGLKGAEETGV